MEKGMMRMNEDIIKFETDIILTDKDGKQIHVEVLPPDYLPEIFGRS